MNGRIYDARLGRFLQADIQVDGVTFTQGYNRYSYGHNNPLSGTDPSGYGFFKEFFDDFLGASESPIINAAVQIGLCYFTGGYGNVYYSAAFAGTQTYEYGGSFGQAIGNGIIAGVSAYAFTQVGGDWWQAGLAGGLIGGVTAELQGGNFGHGFASAGIASAFGASDLFGGNAGTRFVATMIVGGTASKITGDKFVNGAASSAMWFIIGGGFDRESHASSETAGEDDWWTGYEMPPEMKERYQYALAVEWPTLPQGLVDAAEGFGDGAYSVFRGAYRFGVHSSRHFSSSPIDRFQTGLEVSALEGAGRLYIGNASAVNRQIIKHIFSSPRNTAYFAGRLIFGTLTIVGGPIAITGDAMHLSNTAVVNAENLAIEGVLGY